MSGAARLRSTRASARALRDELRRLRKENRTLKKMEKEIPNKSRSSSPRKPTGAERGVLVQRRGEDRLPSRPEVPRSGGQPHELPRLGAPSDRALSDG